MKVKLVPVTELDEFVGWDSPANLTEISLAIEYQHAWKDFFNTYSCPLTTTPKSFKLAKEFCQRINLPFRWFLRWSIQILEHFPQPWELNLYWLQEEISDIWLEVQNVKVPKEVSPTWQLTTILKAHQF